MIENGVIGKNNYVYSVPIGMLKLVLETINISRKQDSNSSSESIKKSKKGFISKLRHLFRI